MAAALLATLFVALCAPAAQAQSLPGVSGSSAAPAAAAAPDPYGRETPRGLANGLIAALAAQDYDRAAHYFDLSHVAKANRRSVGAASARRLQALLDSGGSLVPFIQLSNEPAGRIDDQLPGNQERIGSLPAAAGEDVPLLASLSPSETGPQVWRISTQSLAAMARATALPAERDTLRDELPAVLTDTNFAGAPLSDWLILLVTAAFFYAVVRLVFTVALMLVGRWKQDRENSRAWRLLHAASSPLSLWGATILFLGTTRSLHVAIVARQFVSRFAGAIALIALAWFLWRLVDVIVDLIATRMQRSQRHRARSILIFTRRAVKIVLVVLALVAALDSLGIDVTTGIAALGLGGLAIALGAQKTVENIVGSISVIADQPVRVGDFCRVGDVVGTVEDIGIRSTRIRTNERTRVTIPNGNFAALQIENYTLRDRYLFNPTLGLSYDLDADGLERVLAAIRAALAEADFLMEGARATFAGFDESSLDIELFGWIDVPDFTESLYLKEKLLLDIMRRVTEAGGSFAFPTRALRIEAAEGLKPFVAQEGRAGDRGGLQPKAARSSATTDPTRDTDGA